VTDKPNYFDQAAETLERAFKAKNLGEQGVLLDEALRLHRLAVAEERARLAKIRASCVMAEVFPSRSNA